MAQARGRVQDHSMSASTRVRVYPGIIESQAEERFRVDATEAVKQGWHPTEWRWDGTALRVVYAYGRSDPWANPATSAPRRARASSRVATLAAVLVVLVLLVAILARLQA